MVQNTNNDVQLQNNEEKCVSGRSHFHRMIYWCIFINRSKRVPNAEDNHACNVITFVKRDKNFLIECRAYVLG